MSPAAPHLLVRSRHSKAEGDAVRFLGRLAMMRGRVHEVCGPARRTLAFLAAAATRGGIVWIAPPWSPDQLNGDGIARFMEPERIIFVTPPQAGNLLWCAEETLRSGSVSLVVADLPEPPALTPIRRLHLAAEAGAKLGPPPLGLVLTPEGPAPGVETRWAFSHERDGWKLQRQRARTTPPAAWHVTGDRILAAGE